MHGVDLEVVALTAAVDQLAAAVRDRDQAALEAVCDQIADRHGQRVLALLLAQVAGHGR
jgi:hypothetical protein